MHPHEVLEHPACGRGLAALALLGRPCGRRRLEDGAHPRRKGGVPQPADGPHPQPCPEACRLFESAGGGHKLRSLQEAHPARRLGWPFVAVEHGLGGSLALVLSSSVRSPLPAMAVSNGLRPGLAMLTKQLADELGPRGIRVNGLLPGRVATERVAELDALAGDPEAAKAASLRTIPLGRYGEPSEFGRAAAFLLSPAASFVSGAMLPVDGGVMRAL